MQIWLGELWCLCGQSRQEQNGAWLPTPPPFLVISPGQPQGNPLGCTPLLANGSGHPLELGGARRAGNGALGGPKAHRKLQAHPSLASQGSKKSKGSTKSAASQIPLQAQEGEYHRSLEGPPKPGSSRPDPGTSSSVFPGLLGTSLGPRPGPLDLNLWAGQEPGSHKPSRESDARLKSENFAKVVG